MSDLVSGLLAKLEAKERKAQSALGTFWPPEGDESVPGDGEWTFQGDYDGPRVRAEQTGADVAACLMDDYEHTRISAEDGEHIAENDPRSVLRLCRAHRDLINLYRQMIVDGDVVVGGGDAGDGGSWVGCRGDSR